MLSSSTLGAIEVPRRNRLEAAGRPAGIFDGVTEIDGLKDIGFSGNDPSRLDPTEPGLSLT